MDVSFHYLGKKTLTFKSEYEEKELTEKNNVVKLNDKTDRFTLTENADRSKKDFSAGEKIKLFLTSLVTLPVRVLLIEKKSSLTKINPIRLEQTFDIVGRSECASLFYFPASYSESTGVFTPPRFEYGEEIREGKKTYCYNENNVETTLFYEKISALSSVTALMLIAILFFVYGLTIKATTVGMISIGMLIIFIPLSVWIMIRNKKHAEKIREAARRACSYISDGVNSYL